MLITWGDEGFGSTSGQAWTQVYWTGLGQICVWTIPYLWLAIHLDLLFISLYWLFVIYMQKYIFVTLLLTKQYIIGVRSHLINWQQSTPKRALISFVVRFTTFTDYTPQKQTSCSCTDTSTCTPVVIFVFMLVWFLCWRGAEDYHNPAFFCWMFVHVN